jgi:hypothetical protein
MARLFVERRRLVGLPSVRSPRRAGSSRAALQTSRSSCPSSAAARSKAGAMARHGPHQGHRNPRRRECRSVRRVGQTPWRRSRRGLHSIAACDSRILPVQQALRDPIDGAAGRTHYYGERGAVSRTSSPRPRRFLLPWHGQVLDATDLRADGLRIESHQLENLRRHVCGNRKSELFGLGGGYRMVMRPCPG